MALFIRDAEVIALAEEMRRLTNAKNKTEAVRHALQAQLVEMRKVLSARSRLARSKAMADALQSRDSSFDVKAYTDELWGGT